MWRDNKVRDRKYGPADNAISADNGMKGMTEKENTHFRCVHLPSPCMRMLTVRYVL